MAGAHNGLGGCPCGVLRTKEDPQPLATVGGKVYGEYPRLYGHYGPRSDFVVYACRQCGTLYALTRERAAERPEQ